MPNEKNPTVAIAGICAGIMAPIVFLVLVFAEDQAWVLAPITMAIAVMGIFLGYFTTVLSKKNNAKQRALAAYKTVYEFC